MAGRKHVPVMLESVLQHLRPRAGGRYIDATLGGTGYSRGILATEPNVSLVVGVDRDPMAVANAASLERDAAGKFVAVNGRFGSLGRLLEARQLDTPLYDGVVFDLGLSSVQLDDPARGFSFRHDGPLDMRMSSDSDSASAADIVNSAPPRVLESIIQKYGDERFASRIAMQIAHHRAEHGPILTTGALADIVRNAIPAAKRYNQSIDPATRTFQALRIAVNEELKELLNGLQHAEELLAPGGRLVVLSYHSLEGRIVKDFFLRCSGRRRQADSPSDVAGAGSPTLQIVTHAVEMAMADEIADNPRARSARLRAAARTAAAPMSRAAYSRLAEEEAN